MIYAILIFIMLFFAGCSHCPARNVVYRVGVRGGDLYIRINKGGLDQVRKGVEWISPEELEKILRDRAKRRDELDRPKFEPGERVEK